MLFMHICPLKAEQFFNNPEVFYKRCTILLHAP